MYGKVISQPPEGFVPYHQWPEYHVETDAPDFLAPRGVGVDPVGMYRRFWPIVVEEYISDKEPVRADSDPEKISANRILIWQRPFRTSIPHGWRMFSQKSPRLEGIATLDSTEYWATWSESARRYRKKWHTDFLKKEFDIEIISATEFIAAYRHSTIKPPIRKLYLELIERKLQAHTPMEFIAARHAGSKDIAAAMAVINSSTCHGSYYLCGFISPLYEHVPAMVGVIDEWYKRSKEVGIRFLHFGLFWQKGDPDDWKGFSLFKSKFALCYVSYPPTLWRFAKGRLF